MSKKKKPYEVPPNKKIPEIVPPSDPEEPLLISKNDPDSIPDEDPFETPPEEPSVPGERP